MKNYIKYFILFSLSIGYIFAQDIATDSKNKGVFTYYSIKKYRVDFSSKDFSLTISSLPVKIRFLDPKNNNVNVLKSSNYFIQTSLINATDFLDLSNTSNFRPGGRIRLGYQRIIDSISDSYNKGTFSFGGNFFGSIDNILLYNTNLSKTEKKYPLTFGIEMNYTQFFSSRKFLISLTGSLSKGWNDNTLLNYKDISSNSIVNGNIVAFEKFDGKYGVLQTGINKARLSLSIPITFWYLNPIPYCVLVSSSNNKPTYTAGIYTNILSKKINFKKFKLPSTFGFGVDKNYNNGDWGDTNLFIRGSFNIGEY